MRSILLVLLLGPHLGGSVGLSAQTPLSKDPQESNLSSPGPESQTSATLQGAVRYRANPERPWRLSRYYIKDPKQGWLAECVVVLRATQLSRLPPPSKPALHSMDQSNFMFVPETLAIRAGDSVKFTNSDDSLHNVMTNDGETPFNINMSKGDQYTHTFTTAGGLSKPVRLGCVYHGGMRAWIYVFDHPFFQLTGPNGRFQFGSVPPGDYTLEIVHPAGRLNAQRTLHVRAGHDENLEIVLDPRPE